MSKLDKEPSNHREELRILRMADLRDKIPLSQSHIFNLISRGDFPAPFHLIPGGRAVGWLERDIDQWIEQRASADGK